MRSAPSSGPRPEVLARLAQGADAAQAARPRSAPARMLGIVLCLAVAAMVVGIVLAVGTP